MSRARAKPRIEVIPGPHHGSWFHRVPPEKIPPTLAEAIRADGGSLDDIWLQWRLYPPEEGKCLRCGEKEMLYDFGLCDSCFHAVTQGFVELGLLWHLGDEIVKQAGRRLYPNRLLRRPDAWVQGGEKWGIVPGREAEFAKRVDELEEQLRALKRGHVRHRKPLPIP